MLRIAALLLALAGSAYADTGAEQGLALTRTIYLNRAGVTVTPGRNDSTANRSSLVSMPTAIPSWNPSPAVWDETVACLRGMFVKYDVEITETDPGTTPHIEAVFGGTPELLDRDSGSRGVSPFSPSCKVIESSMVFVFTDALPGDNGRKVCELMAQEIGHSYGLDHEFHAASPMSYLSFAGKRAFPNTSVACGESSARPCGAEASPSCRATQNSHALLLERMGAASTGDSEPPSVTITSPADGDAVEPGFEVHATITDNRNVKLATFVIDGIEITARTAPPWTFAAPADLPPGTYAVEVIASDGEHESITELEVTIEGEDVDVDGAAGCTTSRSSSLFCALLLVGLVRRRRR